MKVLRRYHIQNREDYIKYNRLVGQVHQIVHKLKKLQPDDEYRIKTTEQMMNKLSVETREEKPQRRYQIRANSNRMHWDELCDIHVVWHLELLLVMLIVDSPSTSLFCFCACFFCRVSTWASSLRIKISPNVRS